MFSPIRIKSHRNAHCAPRCFPSGRAFGPRIPMLSIGTVYFHRDAARALGKRCWPLATPSRRTLSARSMPLWQTSGSSIAKKHLQFQRACGVLMTRTEHPPAFSILSKNSRANLLALSSASSQNSGNGFLKQGFGACGPAEALVATAEFERSPSSPFLFRDGRAGSGTDFAGAAFAAAPVAERAHTVRELPQSRRGHSCPEMRRVPYGDCATDCAGPRLACALREQARLREMPFGTQWRRFSAHPLGAIARSLRPQQDRISPASQARRPQM